MKVLVAGGAGFIGSHLCDRLLEQGHQVVCADNLITGRRTNIGHLTNHPGFTYLEQDVTQPLDVQADRVYHLASPASPNPYSERSYLKFPLETALVNSQGTLRLLELATRTGARLLFASTSEVYGNPEVHPQPESYWGNVNSMGPRSCYDESKRFGEALVTTFISKYSVDARIVRIFNTYGPRMDPEDGRVVPNFVSQALRNSPMTIYGDGSQTRSLCYVDDMVSGLLAVMEAPDAAGEVFNVGNPEERTIKEYAELIRELCGARSDFAYLPLPQDDPARRRPDITKIKTRLGWEAQINVRDGLSRTIEWFRAEVLSAQPR